MFEKTKLRIAAFEESHDEARVVIEHVKKYQLLYAIGGTAGVTLLLSRTIAPPQPTQIIINNTPTISPVFLPVYHVDPS